MEQANIIHIYNQIHSNLAALAATNRLIISRMTNTNVTMSPAMSQHLFEIYKCNMQQCDIYNLQINHLLETLRINSRNVIPSMSESQETPMRPMSVPAPVPAPLSITTSFFRRTADGRDIPISQEEYTRLSTATTAATPAATPATPTDPFMMLNLLANAISTLDAGDGGATEEEITQATRNTTFGEIENPCSGSCPITHEDFTQNSNVAVINQCGHIFMRDDLAQWLRRDGRCPMCRHDIRVRERNNNMDNLISSLGLNNGDNITVRTYHTHRPSR